MPEALLPQNEAERIAALHDLHILDTSIEERFERITRLAARVFDVPIALVSMVDTNRQWFKSCVGLPLRETPRNMSFCAYAIHSDDALVIPDALDDPRFADNPLVTGEPYIRFYAGQPLTVPGGYRVGTLCIIDRQPRDMSSGDLETLRLLASLVETELHAVTLQDALKAKREHEQRLAIQEEQLRNQLGFIHAVTSNLGEGVYTLDRDGLLTFMNPAAEELLGWKQEELLGKEMHAAVHYQREDGTRVPSKECPVLNVLRSDSTVRVVDDVFTRKDGSIIPVSYVSSSILSDGRVTGAVLAFHDITERRESERELRAALGELESQYEEADRAQGEARAVLDAASDAMILVGPNREFRSVNKRFEEMFEIDSTEVLGRTFEQVQTHLERIFADLDTLHHLVADSAANSQKVFTDIVAQRWPQKRELHLFSTPVRGVEGHFLGRLYVFRDVTDEREAERMKTEFVSMVSHELRTPLTSIKGYIDLLLEDEVGEVGAEQREFLTIARNNADRLVALVNDLLDVSRIESGKIQLNVQPLDIGPLVEGVVRSLRPQFELKHLHLDLRVPDGIPAVMGDVDRVIQIVTNLVSNAIKYTPPEGNVYIEAHVAGSFVRVDVSDTGIGLSADEQKRVFSRFFRARNRATQEAGGTGLGLSIARSLVELQGGTISLHSTPGEGSTFSFTLPRAERQAARIWNESLVPVGGTILVVDDEPEISDLIRRYLERAGYAVLIAHNAREAVAIAHEQRPDLITLDIMLPDVDGFTILERLKNDRETAAIPVIMLSILDDTGQGRMLGAVDYVTKPLQESVLLEHVGRALEGNHRPQSILVADDDASWREATAHVLRRSGFQVIEASSGAEALELVSRTPPSLVLLDIDLRDMEGSSILRKLQGNDDTRTLPVIVMTDSHRLTAESEAVVNALGSPVLLSKPCTPEELVKAIIKGRTGPGKS